jgi:hypothetical protein
VGPGLPEAAQLAVGVVEQQLRHAGKQRDDVTVQPIGDEQLPRPDDLQPGVQALARSLSPRMLRDTSSLPVGRSL